MEKESYIEKLLNDFVFLDCRLGSHPKLRTSVFWVPIENRVAVARTKNEVKGDTNAASILAVPIFLGNQVSGVLTFDSKSKNFFEDRHIGKAELLARIIAYAKERAESRIVTPTSVSIGKALKQAREELGITQQQLAEKTKQNRIGISRWESGAQPPSMKAFYDWGQALGLLSDSNPSIVTTVDITSTLFNLLKNNPQRLAELSPSEFETFIAEKLDRMGFDVTLTGATSHRDGGIDLVAVPKVRTVGSFLLAGQVKHHMRDQKTGREAVDRLLAWKDSPFRLGLLVTNTAFTKDARWVAEQTSNKAFLRLRDFSDLKRWIEDNFWSEEDWQEIPDEIQLAPGVKVAIPKVNIVNPFKIWPDSGATIKNIRG